MSQYSVIINETIKDSIHKDTLDLKQTFFTFLQERHRYNEEYSKIFDNDTRKKVSSVLSNLDTKKFDQNISRINDSFNAHDTSALIELLDENNDEFEEIKKTEEVLAIDHNILDQAIRLEEQIIHIDTNIIKIYDDLQLLRQETLKDSTITTLLKHDDKAIHNLDNKESLSQVLENYSEMLGNVENVINQNLKAFTGRKFTFDVADENKNLIGGLNSTKDLHQALTNNSKVYNIKTKLDNPSESLPSNRLLTILQGENYTNDIEFCNQEKAKDNIENHHKKTSNLSLGLCILTFGLSALIRIAIQKLQKHKNSQPGSNLSSPEATNLSNNNPQLSQ